MLEQKERGLLSVETTPPWTRDMEILSLEIEENEYWQMLSAVFG